MSDNVYKCKCGSEDFKIKISCRPQDVQDDSALDSIICSKCGDNIYDF